MNDFRPLLGETRPFLGNRVQVDDQGCWNWLGYVTTWGYPHTHDSIPAHRRSYALHIGPLEQGKVIHHRCRNKKCVNPAHLEQLTPKEHSAIHKDELPEQRIASECSKCGAPRTEENTYLYVDKRGKLHRYCRPCVRRRGRESYRRKHTRHV